MILLYQLSLHITATETGDEMKMTIITEYSE